MIEIIVCYLCVENRFPQIFLREFLKFFNQLLSCQGSHQSAVNARRQKIQVTTTSSRLAFCPHRSDHSRVIHLHPLEKLYPIFHPVTRRQSLPFLYLLKTIPIFLLGEILYTYQKILKVSSCPSPFNLENSDHAEFWKLLCTLRVYIIEVHPIN